MHCLRVVRYFIGCAAVCACACVRVCLCVCVASGFGAHGRAPCLVSCAPSALCQRVLPLCARLAFVRCARNENYLFTPVNYFELKMTILPL